MAKRILAVFCAISLIIIAGYVCFTAVGDLLTYFPYQSFWKNIGMISANLVVCAILIISAVVLLSRR